MLVSFICRAFVVVKSCLLKGFRRREKYSFWLFLDGFWAINLLNEVQFVQNIYQ